MREKTNRRRSLYELISSSVEMPADAVAKMPTFVIRGLHEVEADGCSGILEYCDSRVVLSCSFGVLGKEHRMTVTGEMLTLSDFSDGVLHIRGNIQSVALTEE